MSTDALVVPNDDTPLDFLLFRRYRRQVAGLVEQTLAGNYDLANLGALPPRGTEVSVVTPAPAKKTRIRPSIRLYG